MQYRLWLGRKVNIYQNNKFIGIAVYKGSQKLLVKNKSKWVKFFLLIAGKYKNNIITDQNYQWMPVKIGNEEITGLQ